MDRQPEITCFWCDVDVSSEAWHAPDDSLPITHEMVHAFMQAFPGIKPISYADIEPQDYLGKDVYFLTTEWPIFQAWAVQQGYWPIEAVLARAVERDKDAKHTRSAQAVARASRRRTDDSLGEDDIPF